MSGLKIKLVISIPFIISFGVYNSLSNSTPGTLTFNYNSCMDSLGNVIAPEKPKAMEKCEANSRFLAINPNSIDGMLDVNVYSLFRTCVVTFSLRESINKMESCLLALNRAVLEPNPS